MLTLNIHLLKYNNCVATKNIASLCNITAAPVNIENSDFKKNLQADTRRKLLIYLTCPSCSDDNALDA